MYWYRIIPVYLLIIIVLAVWMIKEFWSLFLVLFLTALGFTAVKLYIDTPKTKLKPSDKDDNNLLSEQL